MDLASRLRIPTLPHLATAALLAACLSATAAEITIDFNGVSTGGGSVAGAGVASYLGGYGVTTPNTLTVIDTHTAARFIDSPTKNILTGGDGRNPTILTLSFAESVSNFRFTRAGIHGAHSPSGTIAGNWTATAYDAANASLGSVGEELTSFFGSRPSREFAINASTIRKVVFAGYDHGFAGINTPHVTLVKFTTGTVSHTLAIALSGPGSVTSSPPGLTCQPLCSANFASGTTVSLSAMPQPGARFQGWSGACSGTGACNVTMTAAATVGANFAAKIPTTTTLSSSANPSTLGQTVTFTATVQPAANSPGGTVTIRNAGNIACGPLTLAGTQVQCSLSNLTVGTHSFGADYSGDANHVPSTAPLLSQVVNAPPAVGVLSASATAVDFGGQSMATTSPPKTVTLTNTGNGPLTISSMTLSGAGFAQTNDCASLAAGASCTVVLTFTPAADAGAPLNAAIAASGTLAISSNAAASPLSITLTGSAEKSLVTHYYRAILRRAPDAAGKSFWEGEAKRLVELSVNLNETWFVMAGYFFNSGEYSQSNKSDSEFVTDLYRTFFNRNPDAGGHAYWVGEIGAGLPREVVLFSFMFSNEFRSFTEGIFGNTQARADTDMVIDLYRGLLNRLPDTPSLHYWLRRIREAQCVGPAAAYAEIDAISAAFMFSTEYGARARNPTQLVTDLYYAFLRRGGDRSGVRFWIDELNAGRRSPDRLRREFIASAEFGGRVNALIAIGCGPLETASAHLQAATGGTITLPSGHSVSVPPGALDGDQLVTLGLLGPAKPTIPNRMVDWAGPTLSLAARIRSAPSAGEIRFAIQERPSSRMIGSAAVVDLFDTAGADNFFGVPGNFDPASGRAEIILDGRLAAGTSRLVAGMANLVPMASSRFAQPFPKTIFVPPPGQKEWSAESGWGNFKGGCPTGPVLVFVHGILSSVGNAFPGAPDLHGNSCVGDIVRGKAQNQSAAPADRPIYDRVLGLDYDFTQGIANSALPLTSFLSTLAACPGVTHIDIQAHSMGGPVSASAILNLPAPYLAKIKNLAAHGSPWRGTPLTVAGLAQQAHGFVRPGWIARQTMFLNLTGLSTLIAPTTLEELQSSPMPLEFLVDSALLRDLQTRMGGLDTNIVLSAGNRLPVVGRILSEAFGAVIGESDGVGAPSSALATGVSLRKAWRLPVYQLSHTKLQCDPQVINDTAARMVKPARPPCTYSEWSACRPDDTRTRSVLPGSPANCEGPAVHTGACRYSCGPRTCADRCLSELIACNATCTSGTLLDQHRCLNACLDKYRDCPGYSNPVTCTCQHTLSLSSTLGTKYGIAGTQRAHEPTRSAGASSRSGPSRRWYEGRAS